MANLAAAEAVQDKIDALQRELHEAVTKSAFSFDEKRAAVLSERDAAVADMIARKELPDSFWADAIVSFLTLRHKEDETMTNFLGPYDAELLKGYLVKVAVTYKPGGYRLTLTFRENPFFEETELYAEFTKVSAGEKPSSDKKKADADGSAEDEDEEDEEGPIQDESMEFSGVTWKPGHGPVPPEDDDEESDEESDEEGDDKGGRKRPREEKGDKPKRSATEGPTMLEAFSVMAPHPEDDSELDEDIDDDELADMVDEWRSEIDDRRELVALLAEEMFVAPHLAIKGLAEIENIVEELKNKAPKLEA